MTLRLMKMKTLVMVVILFLVTLSLGVATYSWYIVSTAPSIRAVETYMKVIDPVLSIARATDDKTPPAEVTNQDARNAVDGTLSEADKYYDITWGAVVDSFKNDTLQIDYPATYDEDDCLIKTASFGEDMRMDKLVPLKAGKLGYDLNGEYGTYGIRYYTDPTGKRVCAIGLGVWLRINQENHDLVMSVANTTVKNAAGDVVVSNENVRVAARVVSEGYSGNEYVNTEYTENTGTHVGVIYDKDGPEGAFPENEPILVEILIYMEGDNDGDVSESAKDQIGLLAKTVSQQLYVNIESVTFYDNVDIVS